MFKVLKVVILFISFKQTHTQTWLIDDILSFNYNPKKSPNPNGVTNVSLSITLNELLAVTESDSSFQVDLTMKLKWFDSRLNLSTAVKEQIENPNNTIGDLIFDSSFVPKLWIPDIYFQNAMSASIVNSDLKIQFLAIGLNQNITYTVRLNGKFNCQMDLVSFPHDFQYCSIEAVSLTQTSDELLLNWDSFETVSINHPKFHIRKHTLVDCARASYSGDLSCKSAKLKLARRLGYYVIQVYAPTFLSVIVTFVGFWIPLMGFPGRVTIVVIPLLVLITQDKSLNNDINVAYVVAINWWMIWCQIFVYLGLVEIAVAISWTLHVNEKKALKTTEMGQKGIVIVKGHYFGNKGWYAKLGKFVDKILHAVFGSIDYYKDPLMRNKVDYCSRIVFPLMWIVYCLLYILSTICPWAANYYL